MIAIIDYGMGNLRSVAGAVKRLGHEVVVSNRVADLINSEKLILPGVGAFGDAMRNLRDLGLVEPLDMMVMKKGKPILGICLGCQLMAKESFEFGHHAGLGWLDASVIKIEVPDRALRVPHVGWNQLIRIRDDVLLEGIPDEALFYFVHSFHLACSDRKAVTGESEYGIRFAASFHKDNIYATQFHPEKSQLDGLTLLGNFLSKA